VIASTIHDAGRLLRSGQISVVELVEEALRGAEADQRLNAFITITGDQARQEARVLDAELRAGQNRGPLHGIPIGLKDLVYTRGVRSTNGSKLFENFVPSFDATLLTKLSAAGAISIGKLNMHEMAYGISSSNHWYGSVRNPWNPDCIPGGSSGGSGVTVATGTVFCAIGSDTGGSIRNPAAYCGVVGIKPTFGRVSRHGVFPLGLTLDTLGPLTRSVADAALVLGVMSGGDPKDDATGTRGTEEFVPAGDNGAPALKGVRIGVPENFFLARLHPDVAAAYQNALRIAESLGAILVPVHVPDPEGLNAIARTTLLSEASAVLQPYWERRDEIAPEVLTLLDQGRLVTATEYVNAQRLRRHMQGSWRTMFAGIDVLLTPSSPVPAPKIGQTTVEIDGQPEDTRLASTRLLRGVNALGLPGLAIPAGLTELERMPIGLQLIGAAWSEKRLFAYGHALESALPKISLP